MEQENHTIIVDLKDANKFIKQITEMKIIPIGTFMTGSGFFIIIKNVDKKRIDEMEKTIELA